MRHQWAIVGYTVQVEPSGSLDRPGYDWRLLDRHNVYHAGGWAPDEAAALRACLELLERACELLVPKHLPA